MESCRPSRRRWIPRSARVLSCWPVAISPRSSGKCRRRGLPHPWIESGRTLGDLKALTDPFDPLAYASRLVGKRVIMMAGKVDEVDPASSARALWEAAGRPPIRWYDCGHYSAVGFLLPGIRQTVDFFAGPERQSSGLSRILGNWGSLCVQHSGRSASLGRFRLSETDLGVNLPETRTSVISFVERGTGMTACVTSVFLYVKDVRRSLEFYNEVVGAEVVQIHAEHEMRRIPSRSSASASSP